MSFTPAPPTATVASKPPAQMTIANASAAGTTAGAPTPLSMGPPPGTGLVGSGQAPQKPQAATAPPRVGGPVPTRPPIVAHAGTKSVGTHASKRGIQMTK